MGCEAFLWAGEAVGNHCPGPVVRQGTERMELGVKLFVCFSGAALTLVAIAEVQGAGPGPRQRVCPWGRGRRW